MIICRRRFSRMNARATVFEDGKWAAGIDSAEDGDAAAFDGLNGDDYV